MRWRTLYARLIDELLQTEKRVFETRAKHLVHLSAEFSLGSLRGIISPI